MSVCTAAIKSYEGHVFHCAQPAGHYDEGRQPEPLVDDDPGGWHRSEPDREGCPMTWSDWASGATPHGAGSAPADATVCTPIPGATLTQMSEVPPELLGEQHLGRAENALERLRLAREALIRDGYFTADEVGPDIAPRIVEWLSHHRGLIETLNSEVARLRAGEESGWDPMVVPTPGQWIARWNSLSPAERLARAKAVIETAETANRCQFDGHRQRLEEDQQAWATVARVTELRDAWLLMTLEPGQVRRLLDAITRTLNGQSVADTTQAEPAVAGQPLTETQAAAVYAAYLPRGARITREVVDEAVRQMDADPHGLEAGMVVKPYTVRGQQYWVFRCWGVGDGCDGWLGLGHHSEQSAQRERDRHVVEVRTAEEQVMPSPKRILIDAPNGATVLAARHLDATEGPVQVGSPVDAATRSAITTVLRYVAKAHNSPAVPADPPSVCSDAACAEAAITRVRKAVDSVRAAGRNYTPTAPYDKGVAVAIDWVTSRVLEAIDVRLVANSPLEGAEEAELADRHRRLGIELEHWQTVTVPELCAERDEARTALREVLAAFATVTSPTSGVPMGYQAPPIHPDDMDRWRAALNQPKEQ